jgi:hypothetical protein
MNTGEKQYKKGDMLVLSTGEWSEYGIELISKVLKDFTEQEVVNLYNLHNEKEDDCDFKKEKFITILINEGYIEELEYQEWNFSNYSSLIFS